MGLFRAISIASALLGCAFGALSQEADSVLVETPAYAGQVKASVKVDRPQVPQNRKVICTIEVSWHGDLSRFQVESVPNPELTNFDLTGHSSANWVGDVKGIKKTVKTHEFVLQPKELGMAYVDGTVIEYRDRETGQTHRLITNRIEVEVTAPVAERDHGTFGVIGALLLALVLLAAAVVWFIRRRRAREAEEKAKALESIPVEERFLSEMKTRITIGDSAWSETFSVLSRLLRRYLSQKYGMSATGLATHEICDELRRQEVDDKMIRQVEEILNSADVARFSGKQVDRSVLERAVTLTEDILQRNKPATEQSPSMQEAAGNKS